MSIPAEFVCVGKLGVGPLFPGVLCWYLWEIPSRFWNKYNVRFVMAYLINEVFAFVGVSGYGDSVRVGQYYQKML
jgi:hypothetical protein